VTAAVTLLAAEAGGHRRRLAGHVALATSGSRLAPGASARTTTAQHGVATYGQRPTPVHLGSARRLHLTKAGSKVFDVRTLRGGVVKRERPERALPGESEAAVSPTAAPRAGRRAYTVAHPSGVAPARIDAPAPAPSASFEGLDFATFGAGHPPDTNGDVGPTYYIQTINTSVGIFDKSNGNRVAAFTFNAFMSQGSFGNLCDTDNFGDPVVLYDTFVDRWVITDFAFQLDGSGNVNPPHAFECFAVSKTGDPVSGGWNFYSIETPGGLGDYPKLGIWPDGIYMAANMFDYAASGSYQAPHVWALNKAQMYAGAASVQVVDFAAPADDFTLLPANARLQAGTPPGGTPEFFVSTATALDGLTVYKLHADWSNTALSTFTGPDFQGAATCWPNESVDDIPTPGNPLDSLGVRAMAQAQYSKIGGAESVWVAHTVRRGTPTCPGITGGSAAVRWYQLNVTGGTVATNVVQGTTFDPDGLNINHRWMPSLAVDASGDMAIGYSKANATTNPQIKYAGRLAADPLNTFSQTEQTLIDGTGTQTGSCGGTCSRWGDYSGMALDPDGCTFWMTSEYYAANGLNHHTRIGSFKFPSCGVTSALTAAKAGTGTGTVGSSPAGIDCGATCTSPFNNGTVVTLTATPAAGSSFGGWSGACSGTGTCVVTISAATSVTATFTLQSRALKVTKTGNGTGKVKSSPAGISCPRACGASYAYGTAVTLTAVRSGVSKFSGWKGACRGTSTRCVLSLTANASATATFLACKVPKVIGLALAKAKTKLKNAHCAVGAITKKKAAKAKKGKVLAQSQKPGRTLKVGTKVKLNVGK
jgi:hypothetical protein